MLRVTAGSAKNKVLAALEGNTRPVTDRIKIKVFDLLREFIPTARVLDLFAGSGAYGIEALSRGAKSAVFIENSPAACDLIKKNITNCGFNELSEVICGSLPQALSQCTSEFDIIFCDPPFNLIDKFNLANYLGLISTQNIFVLRLPAEVSLDKYSNLIVHSEIVGISCLYFLRQPK